MRHVWILNHYAQEPSGIGGTRHFHLAQHLKAYKWEASLIAASVDFSTGRQRLTSNESSRLETIYGIPFLWVRTPAYHGNGIGRIINMMAYVWQVLRPSALRRLQRPDVVIGSSVHPFAAAAGALLARRLRVPFVFEVRDLWPQTLIDMGRLPANSLLANLLRRLERWLYLRAKRIVILLPHAADYIAPLGIPRDRIAWIPNGVDLSLFPVRSNRSDRGSSAFSLMYLGAHGQANGIENILHAMRLVQENPRGAGIRLRLIGEGPLKSELIAAAAKLQLNNVTFEAGIPKSDIPRVAAEADAFVIAILNLPRLYRYGISMNKLFDYMAAGRPVVIASGASNNPIDEAGAGISVRAEDPVELARAILDVAHASPEQRQAMGRAGRVFVEHNHDFSVLANKLADVLNDACE